MNNWSMYAKTSNCSLFLPDVYSLRLRVYRRLLWRPTTPAISNKHHEVPGCLPQWVLSLRVHTPNLTPAFLSVYLCVYNLFIPSMSLVRVPDPSLGHHSTETYEKTPRKKTMIEKLQAHQGWDVQRKQRKCCLLKPSPQAWSKLRPSDLFTAASCE